MSLWLVRFLRDGTSMEARCLVEAGSAGEAEELAREDWSHPDSSWPAERFDRVLVEPNVPFRGVLRWWEEPA